MMTGKHIQLVPYERQWLNRLATWRNDPETWAGFFNKFPVHPDGQERWFEQEVLGTATPCFMAIRLVDAEDVIGTISLSRLDAFNRSAELGNILIGEKEYRGRGYASEAVHLMLDYGFKKLGLHRIYLHVREDNVRAVACYEQCGFKREGVLRGALFDDGKHINVLVMSVLEGKRTGG